MFSSGRRSGSVRIPTPGLFHSQKTVPLKRGPEIKRNNPFFCQLFQDIVLCHLYEFFTFFFHHGPFDLNLHPAH